MKEVFSKYYNNNIKLERWQLIGVICLIIVISGCFGWIYEFIFYYFNSGMKVFYYQGGNFLPWINIYAYGAIIIWGLTYKLKKHPFLVFLLGFVSSGILEYFSGLVIYEMFGLRFWDYNVEILNFGNIGGFVCLRSVAFFGLSGLILVYGMIPFCIYLSKKMNRKTFLVLSISLCFIILFDEVYNLIIARILGLSRATQIYEKLGFKFMNYK